MIDEPISNPPTQPTPGVGPTPSPTGVPESGPGGLEPRPFELPSGPQAGKAAEAAPAKQSPMDLARDSAHAQGWDPEDIQDNMKLLQTQLSDAGKKLQNTDVTRKFSDDHYAALNKLTEKMNPDMRQIAKLTEGEFSPPQPTKEGGALNHVLNWIGGAQDMLKGALQYAGTMKNPNPADMMRLQFAMHRATERGELFASIIGSTVSGIKTIMSAQLG